MSGYPYPAIRPSLARYRTWDGPIQIVHVGDPETVAPGPSLPSSFSPPTMLIHYPLSEIYRWADMSVRPLFIFALVASLLACADNQEFQRRLAGESLMNGQFRSYTSEAE